MVVCLEGYQMQTRASYVSLRGAGGKLFTCLKSYIECHVGEKTQ